MKNILSTALLVFFFGCSPKNDDTKPQSTEKNYNGNVATVLNVTTAKGEFAPDFSWTDSTGKKIKFSELTKGKPVLINFWATWCGPCRNETPDLVSVDEEYSKKGAVVIGISGDKDADALTLVSDFTKEFNIPYPVIIDNGDLEEAFGGLRGYPTSFYIDRNGMIVKRMLGAQSKETFMKEFDALL